jgi:hypothetical protein
MIIGSNLLTRDYRSLSITGALRLSVMTSTKHTPRDHPLKVEYAGESRPTCTLQVRNHNAIIGRASRQYHQLSTISIVPGRLESTARYRRFPTRRPF